MGRAEGTQGGPPTSPGCSTPRTGAAPRAGKPRCRPLTSRSSPQGPSLHACASLINALPTCAICSYFFSRPFYQQAHARRRDIMQRYGLYNSFLNLVLQELETSCATSIEHSMGNMQPPTVVILNKCACFASTMLACTTNDVWILTADETQLPT